jgi:hypothetical protein
MISTLATEEIRAKDSTMYDSIVGDFEAHAASDQKY